MSKPTVESQISDWVLDLRADIANAEKQAASGPFFPERGITRESLLAYANTCRVQLASPEVSLRAAIGPL